MKPRHLRLAASQGPTLEAAIHNSVWGRVLTPQEIDRVVVDTQ